MSYLLDVSVLMALLLQKHVHNVRATQWQAGQDLAICPLSELGFLRISTQPSYGFTVEQARTLLRQWRTTRTPRFVPCDMPALDGDPPRASSKTTDFYLASLAAKHGMELATLDTGIGHKSAFVIPDHPGTN